MKKSWAQKRDGAPAPHISVLDKAMFGLAPGTRLYISSPREVEAYMAAIPAGEVRDIIRMREDLARAQSDKVGSTFRINCATKQKLRAGHGRPVR